MKFAEIKIPGLSLLRAIVSDTPETRRLGLLVFNWAVPMLFVWQSAAWRAIHTHKMRFPIDIVWIASDQTVSAIAENAPPGCEMGSGLAQYVLELPAGDAGKYGIVQGLKMRITL